MPVADPAAAPEGSPAPGAGRGSEGSPAPDASPESKSPPAPHRRIALVAHDNRKADLLEWARYNAGSLTAHQLVATGTTGKVLESAGMNVTRLLSGPLGGDQQLGAMIAQGQIDVLIFFWDPLEPQPHDPDVKALLRVAVMWNVVVACNRATADYVISSPLFATTYEAAAPSFGAYTERGSPFGGLEAPEQGAAPAPGTARQG